MNRCEGDGIREEVRKLQEDQKLKRIVTACAALIAAASLWGCTPSNIASAESSPIPEGVIASEGETISLKDRPTVEYTIPADAPTGVDGGPGMMETQALDDSFYPEDKRAASTDSAEDAGSIVCLYMVDQSGVVQTMADVDSLDADALIGAMVEEGILADGTEVLSWSQEGTKASLTLNQLTPVYEKAKEEVILACVVNTLTENLDLDSVDVKAGEKDYGTQSFTNEYDAT